MAADDWLARWLPLAVAQAGARPVLEIGCGSGPDTEVLAGAGLRVIAFDLSPTEAEATRRRVPSATVTCQDVRAPFPAAAQGTGLVVASLSLHYFGWDETVGIVARIRQTLAPGGLLLCRLNAADDHHFGASGHPAIEPGLFLVNGQPKRFFDEASVQALFARGWRTVSREHHVTAKYGPTKALWEVVLERSATV